jgi:hypothetical protein
MSTYIELGPVPPEEECQQVGTADYDPAKALAECRRYAEMLRRRFPKAPEGIEFRVRSFPHDFGLYNEVVVCYDPGKPGNVEYALFCENFLPSDWTDDSVLDWRTEV